LTLSFPNCKRLATKRPVESVVSAQGVFAPVPMIVTVAPGIAPPEASTTFPNIDPVACAWTKHGNTIEHTKSTARSKYARLTDPPPLETIQNLFV
jgi:hypothetical protein